MKHHVLALAIMIALTATAVSAKTVLYINSDDTGLKCSELSGQTDKLLCERMETLGYKVNTLKDVQVRDNSSGFIEYLDSTDLIFLGQISNDMINISRFRDAFCGNITSAGKKTIYSVGSALKNITGNESLLGCVFSNTTGIEYIYDDNVFCKKDIALIQGSGYVVKDFESQQRIKIYKTTRNVKIHSPPSTGILGAECDPPGVFGASGFYPTVSMSNNSIFWGLGYASDYTDDTWKIFDRSILFFTNSYELAASHYTIPEKTSKNSDAWIVATIMDNSRRVTAGTANLSLNGEEMGSMDYDNTTGEWRKKINVSEGGAFGIKLDKNLKALDYSANLNAGELEVKILTDYYYPNEESYTIEAAPLVDGTSPPATLTYKIWLSNFSVFSEGYLAEEAEGIFRKTIPIKNYGKLLVEVSASNSTTGLSGGSFKTIEPSVRPNYSQNFSINPAEWNVISIKPEKIGLIFSVTNNDKNLSLPKMTLEATGDIARKITFTTTTTKDIVEPANSTTFRASMDLNFFDYGDYSGDIIALFPETNKSVSIPVSVNYWNVTGDSMNTSPNFWNVVVEPGKRATQNFTIKNLHQKAFAGDIKVSVEGEAKEILKVLSKPEYIKNKRSDALVLEADASSIRDGIYSGKVKVESTVGTDSITVAIEIRRNLSPLIDSVSLKLNGLEKNLTAITWTDVSDLEIVLLRARRSLDDAKAALERKEYLAASASFDSAEDDIRLLESELLDVPPKPLADPFTIFLIAIIVLAAIIMIYMNRDKIEKFISDIQNKLKKKNPPEEKEEREEEEEDIYRTDYY